MILVKDSSRNLHRALRLWAYATVGAGLVATPVLAQLEEITVTARKQEVSLQDAPIAVSAVSGDDFDKSNIAKLDNFNGYVPGLTVAKTDGAGRAVTIRGVGWETAQNLASQPSVLTYVDGIYLANPLSMGIDLGDLERVEVFRGPQGTEFGQGTTGGAINLVTKKPKIGERTGSLKLGVGSFSAINARGSLNIPLGDTAAFRASVQKYSHDGFSEIRGGALDGYDLDDADSITGKLGLAWEPTDQLSILAQAFLFDSDQNAAAQKNVDDPNRDARELTQDFPGIFELKNTNLSLTIEWESASGIKVKSLTGWQELEKRQSVDGDRLTEATIAIDTLGFFQFNNWDVLPFWDNDSDAFSQELSVSYDGDRFDWVVGAYFLDHENFNDFLEAVGPGPFSASAAALANPSPVTLPPFMSVLSFNEFRTVTREDTAVYAQGTYQVTDRVGLTGGLRWQGEDQTDEGAQFFGVFGGFNRQTDDSKVTWKAGIDFDLTDDNLLYGLISTGWKNGGANPGAITNGAIFLGAGFEPEELTSYEIGSRNTFAEGRGWFNITAFFYDHKHLQFNFEDPVPFGGGTGTVPDAEEMGIETEFSWLFNDNWRLDAMVAWQDGELKSDVFSLDVVDFREALGPGVGLFTGGGFATRLALTQSTNLRGNEVPKMADITARIGLTHVATVGNGELTSRLDWVHRGEMQARVFNNPLVDTIPEYDIVNLHFSYEMENRPIRFALSASNLFDEDGVNNVFSNPFGLWTTSNEYIPPREVMASVSFRWE
jgi:iron complex outermembrane receptor protein